MLLLQNQIKGRNTNLAINTTHPPNKETKGTINEEGDEIQ